MRGVGLVDFERDGREVRYRLADPRRMAACELMRTVIGDRLRRLADMARADAPGVGGGPSAGARIGVEVTLWTSP